jgi:hypothetical protein
MKPPIIINEGGSVDIFETVEDAVRYIEPYDAHDPLSKTYDSEGRLLCLSLTGSDKDPIYTRKVVIQDSEDKTIYTAELHNILTKFLLSVKEAQCTKASLNELIQEALKYKTK